MSSITFCKSLYFIFLLSTQSCPSSFLFRAARSASILAVSSHVWRKILHMIWICSRRNSQDSWVERANLYTYLPNCDKLFLNCFEAITLWCYFSNTCVLVLVLCILFDTVAPFRRVRCTRQVECARSIGEVQYVLSGTTLQWMSPWYLMYIQSYAQKLVECANWLVATAESWASAISTTRIQRDITFNSINCGNLKVAVHQQWHCRVLLLEVEEEIHGAWS